MLLYWITGGFWYGGQGLNQQIPCLDQTERTVLVSSSSITASASLCITEFSKSAINLDKRGEGPMGGAEQSASFLPFCAYKR